MPRISQSDSPGILYSEAAPHKKKMQGGNATRRELVSRTNDRPRKYKGGISIHRAFESYVYVGSRDKSVARSRHGREERTLTLCRVG